MTNKSKTGREAGGLFKVLENVIDLVTELEKRGGEIARFGEIKGLGKDVKGVYGFSVRTLVGGEPVVESFGNIKETPRGPVVDEVREPIVDAFEEDDEVVLVAEIPGVSEESVHLEVKGDLVLIRAEEEGRKYAKEVVLPSTVGEKPLSLTAKNGVVEVHFRKEKP